MSGWQKWGEGESPAQLEPTNALSIDRFCPRCKQVTRWTNELDHGLNVACPGCELTASGPLTPDEIELLDKHLVNTMPRRHRGYEFV